MKQNANIYTVLLILSFLATFVGCLFLYFEMSAYDMQKSVPSDLKAPTGMPALLAPEEQAPPTPDDSPAPDDSGAAPEGGDPADAPPNPADAPAELPAE
jgi:hypothetical protein